MMRPVALLLWLAGTLAPVVPARDEHPPLHVIVETIEVDADEFQKWLFENRMSGDATPLRHEVQAWIKAGRGKVLHTAIAAGLSGDRIKSVSAKEIIFATEMDPPELPNEVDLSGAATRAPETALGGTAFETREEGVLFEADTVVGSDGFTIDVNLSLNITTKVRHDRWPVTEKITSSSMEMPVFRTRNVSTQLILLAGRHVLLGSAAMQDPKNRTILHFLRVDLDDSAEEK